MIDSIIMHATPAVAILYQTAFQTDERLVYNLVEIRVIKEAIYMSSIRHNRTDGT